MILVVQRCAMYQRHILDSLADGNLTAICVDGYDAALQALRKQHFTLVITDIDVGAGSGFELCRIIRREGLAPAVMFVSVNSVAADRVLGLEMGADDFVSYPCHARELQARVGVQLRHARIAGITSSQAIAAQSTIRCGNIVIDDSCHEVRVNDRQIYLTATEYRLLCYLARSPNQVFTRAQLLDAVWDYHHSGYEHTVNSHINRLRGKLGEASAAAIETVWGVGYRFRPVAQRRPRTAGDRAVVPLRQSI